MYKALIKPILFLFNPEKAHNLTFSLLKFFLAPGFMKKWVSSMYCINSGNLERTIAGIKFPNPVGLGAGLDKDAIVTDELSCLGFGFIEIGTVTPKAQPGNDKPRGFRLPKDEALINRMGFNNHGAKAAVEKLRQRKNRKVVIGGNIGKNKNTPNENAVDDYVICFNELFEVVDYFVVNVSSPNTPNLRELQDKEPFVRTWICLWLRRHNRACSRLWNNLNWPTKNCAASFRAYVLSLPPPYMGWDLVCLTKSKAQPKY